MNTQKGVRQSLSGLENCRRRFVGGIFVCLVIATGFWSVRQTAFAQVGSERPNPVPPKEKPKKAESNQPLGNDVATFEKRPILRRIFAPRDAVVREVHVKEGQTVKKGDLLVKFSSFDLEWQTVELQAELEKAEIRLSALTQKKADFERLNKEAALSKDRLAQLVTNITLAQIEQQTYKKQLDLLTGQRQELTVYAPVAGMIEPVSYRDNLKAHLLDCPVNRGEYLFDIGPLPESKNKNKRKPRHEIYTRYKAQIIACGFPEIPAGPRLLPSQPKRNNTRPLRL